MEELAVMSHFSGTGLKDMAIIIFCSPEVVDMASLAD